MKKLYRKGTRTVHPSPPMAPEHLSFLPAAILALTVPLPPEEKEVLAYLISCSFSSSFNGNPNRKTKGIIDGEHSPLFHCICFRCYTSYWSRWNSSPNHKLIHEILETFEEFLSQNATKKKEKKKNKKKFNNNNKNNDSSELKRDEFVTSSLSNESISDLESLGEYSSGNSDTTVIGYIGDASEESDFIDDIEIDEVENGSSKLGSLKKCVSLIGERFLGILGR